MVKKKLVSYQCSQKSLHIETYEKSKKEKSHIENKRPVRKLINFPTIHI